MVSRDKDSTLTDGDLMSLGRQGLEFADPEDDSQGMGEFGEAGGDTGDTQDDGGAPPDFSSQNAPPDDDTIPSGDGFADDPDSSDHGSATPPPDGGGRQPQGSGDAATGTPEFPDFLLQEAGLTAEEAAEQFGTPEALEHAVTLFDRKMMQQTRQSRQQQQYSPPQQGNFGQGPPQQQSQQAPPPAQPAQQQFPSQQQQQQQQEAWKLEPYKVEVSDPNEWDQDVLNLIEGINKHYHDQLQGLRQESQQTVRQLQQHVHQLNAANEQQATRSYFNEFDRLISGLGDSWKETFGEGPTLGMNQSSPTFKERERLDQAILTIVAGRQQNGLPSLPLDQLFQRAVRAEFHQKQEAIAQGKARSRVAGRRRQMIQRPTHRDKAMTGEQRAAQRAEQFYRQRGMHDGIPAQDFTDGI